MAKIEQKLEDHVVQQDKDFDELKADVKDIGKDVSDIKQILTEGDGKIKRNFMLINSHKRKHWQFVTVSIAICSILVALIVRFV